MQQKFYYTNVQKLRALAAFLVVAFHISIIGNSAFEPFFNGRSGVDIFFVISGFVMWITGRDLSPQVFAIRRIIRIVPLYWVCTIVLFFVAFENGLSFGPSEPFHELFFSLFFVGYVNPDDRLIVAPILSPGWTLNNEMFFYLIFAIGLGFFRKMLAGFIIAVLVGMAVVGHSGMFNGPVISFYLHNIILEFAIGIGIGIWATRSTTKPKLWVIAAIATVGLLLIFSGILDTEYRIINFGIGASMIVFATVCLDRIRPQTPRGLMVFLGDASYAIYLVHVPIIGALLPILARLEIERGILVDCLILAFCGLAGSIAHLLFDRPVQRALRNVRPR